MCACPLLPLTPLCGRSEQGLLCIDGLVVCQADVRQQAGGDANRQRQSDVDRQQAAVLVAECVVEEVEQTSGWVGGVGLVYVRGALGFRGCSCIGGQSINRGYTSLHHERRSIVWLLRTGVREKWREIRNTKASQSEAADSSIPSRQLAPKTNMGIQ